MAVLQAHYEELLATCSHYQGALSLLKGYRPYLETLPSMRRPAQSIVTMPLPNISIRRADEVALGPAVSRRRVVTLPCDIALLMCDPEWKIKTGVEIFIFIHRPDEDFSEILSRWRRTQVLLQAGYEWLMPLQHQHLFSEGTDTPYPLFVVFPQTPERLIRGLRGAALPVIVHTPSELGIDPDGKISAAQAAATPTPASESSDLEALANWELDLESPDDRLE